MKVGRFESMREVSKTKSLIAKISYLRKAVINYYPSTVKLRQAIGKDAGDMVTVTLYLIPEEKLVNQKHIIECFKDADRFTKFKSLKQTEQEEIIKSILVLPNEPKQVEKILYFINKLS